ncbi:metalloregulator ArsR/SmtB family transcription factor [Dactylosporangium siamense]|uniref:Transcriptional regulator n=1 Tax=Dactylosporangium siamense TaxID=685454 RepID=A0A919PV43_9ACTN|nr:metalloregulator ArsR/SmtB family transcription factor [Dactylosporangium siamense]GIG50794.1 transcriptional regulator [Dactylosporangium siamense]
MALTVELDVTDLAATRFATSPLSETVACLQQLGGHERRVSTRPWLRWAREQLARDPVNLAWTWPLLVNGRPTWPEFLVPAPTGPHPTVEAELAALRQTPARQVRASLTRVFGADLPPAAAALAADPAEGLRGIAGELRTAHRRLIAPHWPRLRAILDADVLHRAERLATGGAERLFTGLHPEVRWRDGRLMLVGRRWPVEVTVRHAPRGLVLIPVALGQPHVSIKQHTSTQTTVRYPARGTVRLSVEAEAPDAVARLLGRAKAHILEVLRAPTTTTELARALGVTPSAVSQHLAVLRDCGLVQGRRAGRTVLYRTTALGTALRAGPLPARRGDGALRPGR